MAQISYNNVYFPYPMFTTFEQIAVRDDQGDTDSIGIGFKIGVQCLITSAYLPLLAPDLVGQTVSPADIMVIVRNRLRQPRKKLSVQFNGVELIPYQQTGNGGVALGANQSPDNIDARNGPKPGTCRIDDLTNNSFLLTWSVEAFYVESVQLRLNDAIALRTNLTSSPILYNRWSEELHMNHINLCRRTRRGKFMVRSDNVARKIADKFTDQFAIVGVPLGWLRESSQYTVDPSGLAISYEIVDKQQYKMPPEPAYEADGVYIESVETEGAKLYGDCRVKLKGPGVSNVKGGNVYNIQGPGGQQAGKAVNDPQAVLANLAVAVGLHKIQTCLAGVEIAAAINIPANKIILQSASLAIDLWKCEVEFNCRFMGARPTKIKNFLPFEYINTHTYQQERVYAPAYPVHGASSFLLQAAAYYDPALQASPQWDGKNGQWVGGVEPGTGYGGKT